MVAPTGWHGRGFAMGERQDLLLQGRKLLEVQRPVSMALFSPNSDFMILSKSKFFRRFTIDSGDPPFPRDAQDWLFGCYESNEVQVRERQQGHFWISWFCFVCNWECFQKRVITSKSTLVVQSFDVQVGELEEPLVIERTVSSSNPFLVMISFFRFFMIFPSEWGRPRWSWSGRWGVGRYSVWWEGGRFRMGKQPKSS